MSDKGLYARTFNKAIREEIMISPELRYNRLSKTRS